MTLHRVLMVTAAVLIQASAAASQGNGSPEARLRAAMDKETVDGDLKAAIDGYRQVISQRGASRTVVAQALLRLGMAYEKQGDAEARKSYERLVREFSDQPAVVRQARARIAGAATTVASGPTLRRLCSGDCGNRISPDGRWLLVSSGGDGPVVRDLSSARAPRRIVEGVTCCTQFSPDSARIAYGYPVGAKNDGVSVVNIDGSGLRRVTDQGSPLAWSPDGTRLLVARHESNLARLSWVRLADKTVEGLPTTRRNLSVAKVSPDGKFVAFNASPDSEGRSDENVYVMTSDGAGETRVSPGPVYQEPVGWSPDGKYLLYGQYGDQVSLWAVPMANGRVTGSPVQVSQFDRQSTLVGLSSTGTLYYRSVSSTGRPYTASMDPASGKVTSVPVVLPTPNPGGPAAWSPDSRRIALLTGAEPKKELHIFSPEDGKDQRVPTRTPLSNGLCWPGNDSILANTMTDPGGAGPNGMRATRFDVVRINLDTGDTRPVFPAAPTFRLWSCTDTTAVNSEPISVKTRNLNTGMETVLYRFKRPVAAATAKISPDGRLIAFRESIDPETTAVTLVSATGGPVRELARAQAPAELQQGLAWSHDSRFVYFLKRASREAPYALFRVPAAGGAEERMGLQGQELRGLEIAPDGTKLLVVFGAVNRPEIWAMDNFLPSGN